MDPGPSPDRSIPRIGSPFGPIDKRAILGVPPRYGNNAAAFARIARRWRRAPLVPGPMALKDGARIAIADVPDAPDHLLWHTVTTDRTVCAVARVVWGGPPEKLIGAALKGDAESAGTTADPATAPPGLGFGIDAARPSWRRIPGIFTAPQGRLIGT